MSPDPSPDDRHRLRRTADGLIDLLDQLVPLAAAVVTGVRLLGWVCVGAVGVLGLVLALAGDPDLLAGGGLAVVAGLTLGAGLLLLLLHGALRDVLALPDQLRQLPEVTAAHADELGELVAEARRRRRGSRLGFVGDVFRAGRLLLAAHDDLPGYGSALRLVSWPFLVAAAGALLAAPLLVVVTVAAATAIVVF